jgi:chromosome segregation ATPase
MNRDEDEISNLRILLKENDAKAQERLETEKSEMQNTFENTISELRHQCEGHRSDIQQLAASLSESEGKISHLKSQCMNMHKEKQRVEKEMRILSEQLDREKRLSESVLRAKELALESQLANQVEDVKSVYENKQRNLFGYVADAFRGFYSPCDKMDERAFRMIIGRTKMELERMSKAEQEVRGLLGCVEGRPIQDALAQYLMARR